jgi:hypothetical protein
MDQLKIGTAWVEVEIISEPIVFLTYRGYAAAVGVRVLRNGLEKHLFIGARSLAVGIEPLRVRNGNQFMGIRMRIAKEDDAPTSSYKVAEMEA